MRAGTHRDGAPEGTQHGGRKPPKKPEGAGAGTEAQKKTGTTANATTHTQEGHTTTGEPVLPHPHRTPHNSQASDAVQMTPAHTHQPPTPHVG